MLGGGGCLGRYTLCRNVDNGAVHEEVIVHIAKTVLCSWSNGMDRMQEERERGQCVRSWWDISATKQRLRLRHDTNDNTAI